MEADSILTARRYMKTAVHTQKGEKSTEKFVEFKNLL